MQPFFAALVGRFILTTGILALALTALVAVAALADGRAPDLARVIRVAFGAAPPLAAVWVLLAVRRAQEDVACAALGVRGLHLGTVLCVCAAPVLAFDAPAAPAGVRAEITPAGVVTLDAPGLSIEWRDGAAWRAGDDVPYVGLPAPGAMPGEPDARWRTFGLRVATLWLGLLAVLRLERAHGLAAGMALAGLVFWMGA